LSKKRRSELANDKIVMVVVVVAVSIAIIVWAAAYMGRKTLLVVGGHC
jgi:hypothetical protein